MRSRNIDGDLHAEAPLRILPAVAVQSGSSSYSWRLRFALLAIVAVTAAVYGMRAVAMAGVLVRFPILRRGLLRARSLSG